MRHLLPIIVIVLALWVSGCKTDDGVGPTSLSTACDVLSANADAMKPGPIRYSSTNVKSRRFAGPDLAPDLKTRNHVGQALRCPGFK